jgi:hypothetical protein
MRGEEAMRMYRAHICEYLKALPKKERVRQIRCHQPDGDLCRGTCFSKGKAAEHVVRHGYERGNLPYIGEGDDDMVLSGWESGDGSVMVTTMKKLDDDVQGL